MLRRVLLTVVGVGLAAGPAQPAAAASPAPAHRAARAVPARVAGVDVSQWQEVVDWPRVATTKVRFVIMRATRSTDFIDPTYVTNLTGATTAGLSVGSYHRATPSATPGDARAEADHFLDVARNAPGDVLPVLDIEETGGLAPPDLVDWVRGWVVRVRNQLGVRPMLYASPNFWRVNMGDTLWFANQGYPLWIAHWGVSSPAVPADDWGGAGWTFWQWTNTGHVAGIDPNVDRDRFNGSDLVAGEIASLTVTSTAGGTVTGDRIDCGGGASDCSRLANPGDDLTLTATPGPDATLLGWTGACASAGTSPTCDVNVLGTRTAAAVFGYPVDVELTGTGLGAVVSTPTGLECPGPSCSSVFPAGEDVTLTATPDSASGFVSWGGACAGPVHTCTLTVDGPRSVTARFDATQQLEQDGAGTAFAWGTRTDPGAIGGSYRWEHRKGATASLAFTGGAVTLFTMGGPAFGRARLSIDGVPVDTIDGYARRSGPRPGHRLDGLGPGPHVLTVTVLGTARPKATGTRVGVDAIRAGGELHGNPRPSPSTWATVVDASASGGTLATSGVAGAAATLRFTGTGVTLRTVRGPSMGRAELWIDGVLVRTLDLSAPATTYGVQRTVTGLADASHVVRLVVRGRARRERRGHGHRGGRLDRPVGSLARRIGSWTCPACRVVLG